MNEHHYGTIPGIMFVFLFISVCTVVFCAIYGCDSGGNSAGPPAYTAESWVRCGGPPGGLGYDIRYDFQDFTRWYVTDAVAGFFYSTDRGMTWNPSNSGLEPLEESTSIPVFSVTVDPHDTSILWVGMQYTGHIYKSTDRGMSWQESDGGISPHTGQSFRGFTIDPRSSDIVYAASEVEAYVFEDEGTIGESRESAVGGRVYKSTDGGASWSKIWEGEALCRYIWINPDDPDVIYVSTGFFDRKPLNFPIEGGGGPEDSGGVGILKSTDGGNTWTVIDKQSGLNNVYVSSLYMKPGEPNTLLAGTGSLEAPLINVGGTEKSYGGVYYTDDGGESWQEVISYDIITSVEFCEQNPDIAYAGSSKFFYRSTDGGVTWETYGDEERETWGPPGLNPGVPVDIQTDPEDCERVFINNYIGGNFLSTDGGKSWQLATTGYTGSDPLEVCVDKQNASRVHTITRMAPFKSTDSGITWSGQAYSSLTSGGETIGMDPKTSDHLLVCSEMGIYESADGGQSWELRHMLEPTAAVSDSGKTWGMVVVEEFAFAPSNRRYVYAPTRNTAVLVDMIGSKPGQVRGFGIYRSTDGGTSWTHLNDTAFKECGFMAAAVDPQAPKTVYAAGIQNIGLYKSTDAGDTWTSINDGLPEPYGYFSDIAVAPDNASVLYAGGGSGLFKSTDAGSSWSQLSAGLDPAAAILSIEIDPNDSRIVYVSNRLGIHCSINSGETFSELDQGLGDTILTAPDIDISSDGSVLYAASVGIWRLGTPQGQ